ncbi:MAG: DUF3795 domain-containing protein [Deltaproteobacteria bacterium]|nr:DUF3795 domain-containing protein [Deltaproteobacteria bacterium]
MNYREMTAPCGLDCFNCPVFLANDNEKIRAMVSEKMGIPLEQAVCKGCRGEKGKCPIIPIPCHVYPCAEEKGIEFCSERRWGWKRGQKIRPKASETSISPKNGSCNSITGTRLTLAC